MARATLGLSKREVEVLGLVAEGLTNTKIAGKLFTSKRTIETHRQNLMAKTQTRNTAALVKLAARQGLLPGSSAELAGPPCPAGAWPSSAGHLLQQ